MGAAVRIDDGDPVLRPAAVSLANSIFIVDRGQTGSVLTRYPGAFDPTAGARVWGVLDAKDHMSSMACERRFTTMHDGETYSGTMIGLVCTRPDRRRRGEASAVISAILESARTDGLDFAVLWAGSTDFYRKRGWVWSDAGLFGSLKLSDRQHETRRPSRYTSQQPEGDRLIAAVDVHNRYSGIIVQRPAHIWSTVPLPCTRVDLLVGDDAYAMVGDDGGGKRFIFEIVGNPAGLDELWPELTGSATQIYANSCAAWPTHAWLAQRGFDWVDQNLAHWRRLSGRADRLDLGSQVIPYIDRI